MPNVEIEAGGDKLPAYPQKIYGNTIPAPYAATSTTAKPVSTFCKLAYVCVFETAGAAASLELYDGRDTTGISLGVIVLAANGYQFISFGDAGPEIRNGVFINMLSGSSRGTVGVRPLVHDDV